jgi:hypothetical protein
MQNAQAVIAALDRAPDLIVPLVREAPRDTLRRRPAPGKWSIHEHACHLDAVDQLFVKRLDLILREPAPRITPFDPKRDSEPDELLKVDLDVALDRFVRDRVALVGRLRRLTDAEWQKTAEHPEYSRYSVFIMFRHLALHDLFHAYRIEELVLAK